MFIGSSSESIDILNAIKENIYRDAESTPWTQNVFNLSKFTIESLYDTRQIMDFGNFVFSPDDVVKMRNSSFSAVRDNVVFELGMFIGKLGRGKCFIVKPERNDFHVPSDLLGLTTGTCDTNRSDSNLHAATGTVSNQTRGQIQKVGPRTLLNLIMRFDSSLAHVYDFKAVREFKYDVSVTRIGDQAEGYFELLEKNTINLVRSNKDDRLILDILTYNEQSGTTAHISKAPSSILYKTAMPNAFPFQVIVFFL